jgi:LysM repeat protein
LVYLQRKRRTGNNEFHIVKAGETLNDIAREEAMRIESLIEYNSLDRNVPLTPGQQLNLRTKATGTQKLAVNN